MGAVDAITTRIPTPSERTRTAPLTSASMRGRTVRTSEVVPAPRRAMRGESVSGSILTAGTRLGRYVIRRPIGSGGMGTVYEAEHARLGHRVAIKALHPELALSRESRLRFEREARSAAQLTTRHAPRVIDVDQTAGGLPFIVMELLVGRDLADEWAARRTIPVGELVDVVVGCCDALAEAHALGIVHRDIKPENVFLAREGDAIVPKLLDFGIAKLQGGCPFGLETSRCDLYGTPFYMAPEQARLGAIDQRADVFALGSMLYRILAGRGPFGGDTDTTYLRSLLSDPPLPFELARPDLPYELACVVMRAIARDPAARFQSARELAAALAPFATTSGVADTLDLTEPPTIPVEIDEPRGSRTVVIDDDARASWGTVLAAPPTARPAPPPTAPPEARRSESPRSAPPRASTPAPRSGRALGVVIAITTALFVGSFAVAATGAVERLAGVAASPAATVTER